jgi:hypothetical protein
VPELPRETVDLNAKLKVQLAELSEKAKDRQRLLEANHESVAVAETSLQKNQAELEALEQRLEQILNAKRHMAASMTKVSSEGVAVESQLARMATRLRTLHGHIAQNSTAYTFVAYDGVTGTTRRPILIECTREHIKFLQENVSLSSTDVSGYSALFNPVLAGAQALMDYWTTHSGPDEPRPYVLLIVRPSGPVAYGMARHLLERLKEPFGYELLPDDQLLDVPPAVPEAAEVCRKAVEKAISQRVDAFKDVFGNGTGPRGGRLTGGNGGGAAGKTGLSNGNGKSPFDDAGDSLLGDGPGHGSAQAAAGADGGTSAQPGVPGDTQSASGGANPTPSSATQAGGGEPGTGPLLSGRHDAANGGADTSNPGAPAGVLPGSPGGNSATSGGPPGSVSMSDRGSGALNQLPGLGTGTSSSGAGTQGSASSSRIGLSLVNGGTGTGPSTDPKTGTGTGAAGGAVLTPLTGGLGTGNGNGPDGSLPGTDRSQGDRVAGSSLGTSPSGVAAPRIGTPTPGIPPGSSSSSSPVPSGEVTSVHSPGGLGEGDQEDLPPSLLPPSGGGAAANSVMNSDKVGVGHPTSGSGNEAAAGPATGNPVAQPSLDAGLFGSAGTAPGPASGATSAPASGPVGTGTAGGADGQSGEPSMPGSSSQPQAEPPDLPKRRAIHPQTHKPATAGPFSCGVATNTTRLNVRRSRRPAIGEYPVPEPVSDSSTT